MIPLQIDISNNPTMRMLCQLRVVIPLQIDINNNTEISCFTTGFVVIPLQIDISNNIYCLGSGLVDIVIPYGLILVTTYIVFHSNHIVVIPLQINISNNKDKNKSNDCDVVIPLQININNNYFLINTEARQQKIQLNPIDEKIILFAFINARNTADC